MIDATFKVAVDPLFPPPAGHTNKKGSTGHDVCPYNRYELVFDERIDGDELR